MFWLPLCLYVPEAENPSCLHTTLALKWSHPSSHTVPHALFLQNSTRPSSTVLPPVRRISPSTQPDTKYKKNTWKLIAWQRLFCIICHSLEYKYHIFTVMKVVIYSTASSQILRLKAHPFTLVQDSFSSYAAFYCDLLPMGHLTPASWAWVQELSPLKLAVQFSKTFSLPVHCTLSSHILPIPSPKVAWGNASAPDKYM